MPDRVLGDVVATATWAHSGPARSLVHRLKYDGVTAPADLAAAEGRVPDDVIALVPVPRVSARTVSYGVDPANAFARALGARLGLPVVRCLSAPAWSRRRAGRRRRPAPPRFRMAGDPIPRAVVVDDVITSGATVEAAAALVGAHRAVAITMAPGVKSRGGTGLPHTMRGRDVD